MDTPNRVTPGVPTGGQFAATQRGEADVDLGDASTPASDPSRLSEQDAIDRLVADGVGEDDARQAVMWMGMTGFGLSVEAADGSYTFAAADYDKMKAVVVPQHPEVAAEVIVKHNGQGSTDLRLGKNGGDLVGMVWELPDGTFSSTGPLGNIAGFATRDGAVNAQRLTIEGGSALVPLDSVDDSKAFSDDAEYNGTLRASYAKGPGTVSVRNSNHSEAPDADAIITVDRKQFGGAFKSGEHWTSSGPLGFKTGFVSREAAVKVQSDALRERRVISRLPSIDTEKFTGTHNDAMMAERIRIMRLNRPIDQ